MMLNLILATITVLAVYAYWVYCRNVAIKHQAHAAEVIENFMDDERIPEIDREVAYQLYFAARKWLFLPLGIILVTPVLVADALGIISTKAKGRKAQSYIDTVTDPIAKMYVTRNPLTTAICVLPLLLVLAVTVPFGLLLDRTKSLPDPSAVISSISSAAISFKHHN